MKLLPPTDGERHRLCRLLFICAFGFFVLGFFIDFIGGGELGYFLFVACLFLVPMLIPRGGFRGLAAAFVLISLMLSICGYWRGVQYRTWLAENPLNSIAFVNETEHRLQHIELHSEVNKIGPGALEELAKGEHALLAVWIKPVPAQTLVTWDEDSIHHEVSVNLEEVVPPGIANSTIYFVLRPDGSITVKTADIHDENAKLEILKNSTERNLDKQ
jgi:hypothetical protein